MASANHTPNPAPNDPKNHGFPHAVHSIDEFRENVAKKRIGGHWIPTVFGWALIGTVVSDALLNIGGSGLYSATVAQWLADSDVFKSETGALGPLWRLFAVQILGLAIGFALLFNSPWRLWMRKSLNESFFGTWLSGRSSLQQGPSYGGSDSPNYLGAILRDLAILGACVWILLPLLKPLRAALHLSPLVAALCVVALSVPLACDLVALLSAYKDGPTLRGVILAFVLCTVFAVALDNPGVLGMLLPRDRVRFQYFEFLIVAVPVIGLFSSRFSSVGSLDDLPDLRLSSEQSWIEIELFRPEGKGLFFPVRFRVVQENGLEFLLVHKSAGDPKALTIHKIGEYHDLVMQSTSEPAAGSWHLLNLSRLGTLFKPVVSAVASPGDSPRLRAPLQVEMPSTLGHLALTVDVRLNVQSPENQRTVKFPISILESDYSWVVKKLGQPDFPALSDLLRPTIKEETKDGLEWPPTDIKERLQRAVLERTSPRNPAESVQSAAVQVDDLLSAFNENSVNSWQGLVEYDSELLKAAFREGIMKAHIQVTADLSMQERDRRITEAWNTFQENVKKPSTTFRADKLVANSLDAGYNTLRQDLDSNIKTRISTVLRALVRDENQSNASGNDELFNILAFQVVGDIDLRLASDWKQLLNEIRTISKETTDFCQTLETEFRAALEAAGKNNFELLGKLAEKVSLAPLVEGITAGRNDLTSNRSTPGSSSSTPVPAGPVQATLPGPSYSGADLFS